MPEWKPLAVLVDACDAEIAAVNCAFALGVHVFLCHWHVQRAWKKQLYAKVFLTSLFEEKIHLLQCVIFSASLLQ